MNKTRDDLHIWLAPFYPGKSHVVYIEFSEIVTIAMIRVWVRDFTVIHIHSCKYIKLFDLLELQQIKDTFLQRSERYGYDARRPTHF